LDEEKAKKKHARVDLTKWFWPKILHRMLRLAKGTANPNNNTYTSDWQDGLIGPGGLLLLLLLVPDL